MLLTLISVCCFPRMCWISFTIIAYPAPVRTLKMIVVGHSYVSRLDHFLSRNTQVSDLDFLCQWCVECCRQPGATTCPGRKSLHSVLPQILDKHPDAVFLQIGENDVSNGLCGAKAAGEIVDVVKYLLDGAVSRVMLGQLLPSCQ